MTNYFTSFRRSEEGAATIEFVIWFPLFWSLFLWSFEQGMYLARQVALDRAVDLAVRDVRLGAFSDQPSSGLQNAVKERVCDFAMMIPDCLDRVRVEMERVDPRNWGIFDDSIECTDSTDTGLPATGFTPGQSNDLMVLRACALIDPVFPTSGLGARLEKVSEGAYALVSVTSFAIEPLARE